MVRYRSSYVFITTNQYIPPRAASAFISLASDSIDSDINRAAIEVGKGNVYRNGDFGVDLTLLQGL
jgi:hypothetical protein